MKCIWGSSKTRTKASASRARKTRKYFSIFLLHFFGRSFRFGLFIFLRSQFDARIACFDVHVFSDVVVFAFWCSFVFIVVVIVARFHHQLTMLASSPSFVVFIFDFDIFHRHCRCVAILPFSHRFLSCVTRQLFTWAFCHFRVVECWWPTHKSKICLVYVFFALLSMDFSIPFSHIVVNISFCLSSPLSLFFLLIFCWSCNTINVILHRIHRNVFLYISYSFPTSTSVFFSSSPIR